MTTIFRLTLREAVRRRLVWALLVMTLIVVAVTGWGFAQFVQIGHQHGLLDAEIRLEVSQLLVLVAWMFSFILAMTAVFFGAPAIASDVESGLILGVMARPIRRIDFLLGRWLGLAVLVVGYAVFSGLLETGVAALLTGWVPPDPVAAVLFLGGQGVVLMTLALLLSTRFSVVTGGAIAVVLFGLAWLVGNLARLGAVLKIDALTQAGAVSQIVLPSDVMWRGVASSLEAPSAIIAAIAGQGSTGFDQLFAGTSPTLPELAWVGIWVVILLGAAAISFRNRDV